MYRRHNVTLQIVISYCILPFEGEQEEEQEAFVVVHTPDNHMYSDRLPITRKFKNINTFLN